MIGPPMARSGSSRARLDPGQLAGGGDPGAQPAERHPASSSIPEFGKARARRA